MRNAFTVVEILVVALIVAILSTLALFSSEKLKDKANETAVHSSLFNLSSLVNTITATSDVSVDLSKEYYVKLSSDISDTVLLVCKDMQNVDHLLPIPLRSDMLYEQLYRLYELQNTSPTKYAQLCSSDKYFQIIDIESFGDKWCTIKFLEPEAVTKKKLIKISNF